MEKSIEKEQDAASATMFQFFPIFLVAGLVVQPGSASVEVSVWFSPVGNFQMCRKLQVLAIDNSMTDAHTKSMKAAPITGGFGDGESISIKGNSAPN